jgi:hypothetical protein
VLGWTLIRTKVLVERELRAYELGVEDGTSLRRLRRRGMREERGSEKDARTDQKNEERG